MNELQLLELKGYIEKILIFDIMDHARAIDTDKDPRVRFVLEFVFNERGEIVDGGLETRARRPLRK